MIDLLIPSAKIVPEELQSIGKIPAVIYPINQEIVFDYLFRYYKEKVQKIKVVCYEAATDVERKLENYKKSACIDIIKLKKLGDLAYTVYYGLGKSDSIIINFADTIVEEDIFSIDEDCILYSNDFMSDIWTFFDEENGRITKVYDKILNIENKDANVKKKLFVGVFKINDAQYFKECLKEELENEDNEITTFYRAIKKYSCRYRFKMVDTSKWFDIGHIDKYYNSKLEVKSREFNHIIIDKNRGILKKTSDDKEKFIGEILWYLKLPKDIEYSRPRIFSYNLSYEKPSVEMEYYSYHTVHELFLYGDLSYQQWNNIFERIKFICDDYKRYSIKDNKIIDALEEMYLTKTLNRILKLKENKNFTNFFCKNIVINQKKYKNLNEIMRILKDIIPKKLYDIDEFNIIHGDLCFANILIDNNLSFIKVIDPRGKFGQYDIYGDFRYELAKLFHSLDGKYDFIIKDMFKINVDKENNEISYKMNNQNEKFNKFELFKEVFKEEIGKDLEKIELIEALLFLSMVPLHSESEEHQYMMLATGLEILNRVTNVTDE